MGYLADEPLGDLLDEQGLDHAGKSLRQQQRKAQAIDRDLPDNIGYDAGEDDHIADAFGSSGVDYGKLIREADAQRRAIKDAMIYGTGMNWIPKPVQSGKAMTATDAKRLQDGVTGRDRFTVKGQYAHLNDKELEQEFHNARAAGNMGLSQEIAGEGRRRDKEKADG